MNVAFDPWIPVVTNTGERMLVSLSSVLTEGDKYADLAVRPHERVSLMRLFLCVAHAALNGPESYDEWEGVPQRLPDAAQKYLTEWKDSFELFHAEKPWLQVAELRKSSDEENSVEDVSRWTSVSKLNFSFATGSNSTLFDHEGKENERVISINDTVVSMVAFQCFTVGGLIGQVYWNGVRCGKLANSKKENGPVKSSDGPCIPSSMVHSLLRGKTLVESIHLNLPSYNDISCYGGNPNIGRPAWEMMPCSLSDSQRIQNVTQSYLGRLVPITRLILLHPSGKKMLIGDGFSYPNFASGFQQEPTATVIVQQRRNTEHRALLSYRPSKALWRELSAIVIKRKTEGAGGPLSLRSIQTGEDCDLVVAALARDRATILDAIESVFHIPSRLLVPEGSASYESEVKIAESLANRLGWAIELYRSEVDGGWEGRLKSAGPKKGDLKVKLHAVATINYWTSVENNLSLLMGHIKAIGTEKAIPTREKWRKMLFASACEAFRISCGQETPRQIRAFAKGWQKLTKKRDKSEPDPSESNMEVET